MSVLILVMLLGAEDPLASVKDGPVDFVCDTMKLSSQPNRAKCTKNVVVRRADTILCCDSFEGLMDKDGGWEKLVCSTRVRAQRGDEVMWAEQATFIFASSDWILTGNPRVRRGRSLLRGKRIVIDTKNDRARIEEPRGRLEPASEETAPAANLPLTGELPRRCPVPAAPRP